MVACLAEVAQDMGAPIAAYVDVTSCDLIACTYHVAIFSGMSVISIYICGIASIVFQGVMPLVLKELSSSSSTNRRNAAFCAGELCKNGGISSLKYSSTFVYFGIH